MLTQDELIFLKGLVANGLHYEKNYLEKKTTKENEDRASQLFDRLEKEIANPVQLVILAIEANYWGKGKTIDEAINNMKQQGGKGKEYALYVASPETWVDAMGYMNYPSDCPPVEIGGKKARKTKRG